MVELILSICLLDNANKCREESLVFSEASLLACVVAGQAQIAAHMEHRPRWYVKRWGCQPAGRFAKA